MNLYDCELYPKCKNNSKCHICMNKNLYEETKSKSVKKAPAKQITKSWEDLEQKVVEALNDIPSAHVARRSMASGALWFEKGDVIDEILHPECKERQGKQIDSGTDQSISIKKSWLDKATEEASIGFKTMCLPFRFKNSDDIYVVFELESVKDLVTTMKSIKRDNESLLKEVEVLRNELNSLKNT